MRRLLLACALLALAACSPDGEPPPADATLLPLTITRGDGTSVRVEVEVPCTPEAMARGLSGRRELPEDRGMLFVTGDRGSGFWMKDTLIPLAIAFIDRSGTIVDVQEMAPETTEIHRPDGPAYYALEANGGWFQRHGVREGDAVRFPWPPDGAPLTPWDPASTLCETAVPAAVR
ncbi:MAG TPA: DUF192 domain-containing protein [Dehalococcoidia bacterium]